MTSMAVREGRSRPGEPSPSSAAGVPTFASIYADHAQTVARWAARLGGPSADVEDLTQEVFLVVNRRLGDFRGESRVTTWLFGITAKVAANERRRRKLRALWVRFVPNVDERAPAPVEGALEQLEMRERRALFHGVLDSLSERHRRVLVLFELEELPANEIAELMRLSPGNVRVLLHRARAAFLKAMVARELEEQDVRSQVQPQEPRR
jgi:RNA polymerase sigma-70 factor, ECF subfamily